MGAPARLRRDCAKFVQDIESAAKTVLTETGARVECGFAFGATRRRKKAGIAQLVEHNLAKVGVASSNLVSRSRFPTSAQAGVFCSYRFNGAVAEWLCSGLQLRIRRFDSDPRLHSQACIRCVQFRMTRGYGEIGRHKRLKISRPYGCAGSSPATRTSSPLSFPPCAFYCRPESVSGTLML